MSRVLALSSFSERPSASPSRQFSSSCSFIDASSARLSSRALQRFELSSRDLLRKPRSRRVPEITLPTVEEDPSLACTSLPPASRGHYCSTQHLHLGFFFRVTCSTCDASPGPCAVILATSTVAVLDDVATFSLTG